MRITQQYVDDFRKELRDASLQEEDGCNTVEIKEAALHGIGGWVMDTAVSNQHAHTYAMFLSILQKLLPAVLHPFARLSVDWVDLSARTTFAMKTGPTVFNIWEALDQAVNEKKYCFVYIATFSFAGRAQIVKVGVSIHDPLASPPPPHLPGSMPDTR
jgi:hypothetical protein